MPQLTPIRLTHAQTLIDGAMVDHPVTIADGLVSNGQAPEVDLTGYLLLPGIIDLHGDGFERHFAPRPSAPFDKTRALASVAGELAVNGVTTAWLAQSWSWEGGFRSGAATQDLLQALDRARPDLLTDIRVQIRLETHVVDQHDQVLQAVTDHGVDYVVFNNHPPEAQDMADHHPHRLAQWAAQTRRTSDEMMALVRAAQAQRPLVAGALRALSTRFAELGVQMGSHDDGTAEIRAFYRSLGAPISEFPTSFVAARAAHAAKEPVLMGAPNVVRGGSQTGNIGAEDLITEGLVDALISDYYYPAMSQAAFALVGRGVCDLPRAWDLIARAPARIMGLKDRGHLGTGTRADIVVVNAETQRVEMTFCRGHVAHMSGEAARRFRA